MGAALCRGSNDAIAHARLKQLSIDLRLNNEKGQLFQALWSKPIELGPDEYLYRFSDKADRMFIVVEGAIRLSVAEQVDDKTKRVLLDGISLTPGCVFGQEALYSESVIRLHNAKVEGRGAEVLALDRATFFKHEMEPYLAAFGSRVAEHEIGQKVAFLRQIDFLKELSNEKLGLLSQSFQLRTVKEKDLVYVSGDEPAEFFFLIAGRLSVFTSRSGRKGTLWDVKPMSYFGISSLLTNKPRVTTVKVTSSPLRHALLLSIGKHSFDQLIRREPLAEVKLQTILQGKTSKSLRNYKVPFFAAMSDNSLSALAEACERLTLYPNDVLFTEGEPGDCFYIIESGFIVVYKDENQPLATLTKGQYFGETSLVTQLPRQASIKAGNKKVVLLVIAREHFGAVIAHEPSAQAECALKILGAEAPLECILRHPKAVVLFIEHLRQEYSEENIQFWRTADDYRNKFGLLDELEDEKTDYTVKPSRLVTAVEALEPKLEGKREQTQVEIVRSELQSMGNAFSREFGHRFSTETAAAELLNDVKRRKAALKIFSDFVSTKAATQVNLSATSRTRVEKLLRQDKFPPDLFEQAQQEIFRLMLSNDYDKFKATPAYLDMLNKLGQYSLSPETRLKSSSLIKQGFGTFARRASGTTKAKSHSFNDADQRKSGGGFMDSPPKQGRASASAVSSLSAGIPLPPIVGSPSSSKPPMIREEDADFDEPEGSIKLVKGRSLDSKKNTSAEKIEESLGSPGKTKNKKKKKEVDG